MSTDNQRGSARIYLTNGEEVAVSHPMQKTVDDLRWTTEGNTHLVYLDLGQVAAVVNVFSTQEANA